MKKATTQKLATPLATDADLQATLQQVIGYYHETLKQSPEALDYLKQRGLDGEVGGDGLDTRLGLP